MVLGVSDTLSSSSQLSARPGLLLLPQGWRRLSQWPTSWVNVRERYKLEVPMDPQ